MCLTSGSNYDHRYPISRTFSKTYTHLKPSTTPILSIAPSTTQHHIVFCFCFCFFSFAFF
jgi:hypothetical protein